MAAAASGIWNAHHATSALASLTGGSLPGSPIENPAVGTATPAATTQSSSSSSSASSAGISSNDFLTLLVTEMQNQDPTAATDPNEYINQLVQINSLEQLISINQDLQTVLGVASGGAATATPATSAGSASAVSAAPNAVGPAQSGSPAAGASIAQHSGIAAPAGRAASSFPATFGNLSVPDATPASLQVAQALSGKNGLVHHAAINHGGTPPR